MSTRQEETEFLALLVHRGHLTKDQGVHLFAVMNQGGKTLDAGLAALGWTAEHIAWLRRTKAGEIPEIPGYQILHKLGSGGTANVFLAKEIASGKEMAVKVLLWELGKDVVSRSRFLREAKLLTELEHENLVKGYKVAKARPKGAPEGDDGYYYFSFMEYIEGQTLLELMDKKQTFQEDAALYVILQVARGLEYLREHNIVHRDIKPGNIMITALNKVKLIDLGFAGNISSEDMRKETTVGTVHYISPEQAQGAQDLDSRADIYSLGVTLYHLIIGELPFKGTDDSEIMRKQIVESLSSPSLKSRNISPHMHYFIEKMMAKERDIRYQNPEELMADIEDTIRGKKTLEFHPDNSASKRKSSAFLRAKRKRMR